jgi:hypothetical protein
MIKSIMPLLGVNRNNKEKTMLKNKSIDYVFGMITGASLMLAFWACTNTPLGASGSDVQQVEIVNNAYSNPVPVEVVNN